MEKKEYEELTKIVKGIARQYSKDLYTGKGFNFDKYQELEQELWVKTYEVLKNKPDATLDYIAKCLWRKVTDLFRKEMKTISHEKLVDNSEFSNSSNEEGIDIEVLKKMESVSNLESFTSDEGVEDLIERTLELAKKHSDKVYKFVVAKLKLAGYLSSDFEREVEVSNIKRSDSTEDAQILETILGYKNGKQGGPGSFKGKKYNLRLDLLNEFDCEEEYRRYFDVTYVDLEGCTKSTWIKAYSQTEALEIFSKKYIDTVVVRIIVE